MTLILGLKAFIGTMIANIGQCTTAGFGSINKRSDTYKVLGVKATVNE